MNKLLEYIEKAAVNNGYITMKDLKEKSFQTRDIKKLLEEGIIEKIKPGLYRLVNLEEDENISLSFMDVSKAIPEGVICLLSAISYYDLSTFIPSEIYLAVPHSKKVPVIEYPPVKIFHFRPETFELGISQINTRYGQIRIYDKEKTLCDMFRYRNKIGENLALESLKNYLGTRRYNLVKLMDYAKICRVKNIISPFLKAMLE
jgi:predicted transcriptional regulator of viral defense system